jgi:acyl-CoA oxidase
VTDGVWLSRAQPLPGITLGDIGPKFGTHANDNGYLKMERVRIPRDQMLMRFAQVSREGRYTTPPHAKLAYGTMVVVRASIVAGAAGALAIAATIAIRYSIVRTQGYKVRNRPKEVRRTQKSLSQTHRETERKREPYMHGRELITHARIPPRLGPLQENGKDENSVLDYRMQQYRLFPVIAAAYALHFTGTHVHTHTYIQSYIHTCTHHPPLPPAEVSLCHTAPMGACSARVFVCSLGSQAPTWPLIPLSFSVCLCA